MQCHACRKYFSERETRCPSCDVVRLRSAAKKTVSPSKDSKPEVSLPYSSKEGRSCYNCNAINPFGASQCGKCGRETKSYVPTPSTAPVTAPSLSYYSASPRHQQSQTGNGPSGFYIGLVFLVYVPLIWLVLYILVGVLISLFTGGITGWTPGVAFGGALLLGAIIVMFPPDGGTVADSMRMKAVVADLNQPPKPYQATPTAASSKSTMPEPLFDLTWNTFEEYCRDWSKYLGYRDAEKTRSVKDGGVDIEGSRLVAQVKFQEIPVGVKPIREIIGVNVRLKKDILFFSLNGFSRDAVIEANQSEVALFTIKPFTATILAESTAAKALLERPASERGAPNAMNQGDHHSGPEGYSANTAYSETQYGSGFDDEADWNEEGR